MHLERNVFGILDRTARSVHGETEAFSFTGGDSLTFVELRDRATALAKAIVGAGANPGDHVAVMMNNRREWVETFFALAAAGCVCVPVNILLVAEEIDHVLRDSGATVLIHDNHVAERVNHLSTPLALSVTVGTTLTTPHVEVTFAYDDFIAGADPACQLTGPDLHDPFLLYYTSGTTGAPKGAIQTHNGVIWNAMGQWAAIGVGHRTKAGVISSLSWVAGFHVLVLALVWAGGRSHIRSLGGATAQAVVDMLVDEEITHTFLVPSLLAEIVDDPALVETLQGSRLEWILTGSAPVPIPLLERFSAALPELALCQGYGFSEFPALVCVLEKSEALAHEGSAGRPLPVTQVAVRRDDDTIAATGAGELLVRSLATMSGYHGRPEETARAFRDGWFHTGDLASIDAEGYVTLTGRLKELIISGGLNIYPREIEDQLHQVEGIRECAVVGVPNDKYGEAAVAVVVADASTLDLDGLRTRLEPTLAPYKRPRHYLVRKDALPRNANAKILKREIASWAATELGLPSDK